MPSGQDTPSHIWNYAGFIDPAGIENVQRHNLCSQYFTIYVIVFPQQPLLLLLWLLLLRQEVIVEYIYGLRII